jgi:hypothetical protein
MDYVTGAIIGLSVLGAALGVINLAFIVWCIVEIRLERKTKYEVIHNAIEASRQEPEEVELTGFDAYTRELMRGEL